MGTKLSKKEKQEIKDRRGERVMDEDEWAELMGMTHSEIRERNSGFGDWSKKIDDEKSKKK